MLRIKETDLQEDGIHVEVSKTSRRTIYDWSEELRDVIDEIKTVRVVDISPYLFCTKQGRCYVNEHTGRTEGWDSMWQRFMKRILEETEVTERFSEHDLRAKCASDAENLQHAQKLLSHTDSRTTKQIYMRKPDRVKPSKIQFE